MNKDHAAVVFRRLLKRAGLPHYRVYDLRHTFANLLLGESAPTTSVSARLGHSSPTTMRFYARWSPNQGKPGVNALDRKAAGRARAIAAAEHPTSLHLQEGLRGYVLIGAMYTAADRATSPAVREPQAGRDVHSMRSLATRYHTTATFIAMTTSFGHDTRRVSSITSRGMKAAVAITVT